MQTRFATGVWSKLHLWRLTQWRRIVMLDADTVVLSNLDHLLTTSRLPLSAAQPFTVALVATNGVEWRHGVVGSGFIVLTPSTAVYDAMVAELVTHSRYDVCETDFFNVFFEHTKVVLPHSYLCIAEGLDYFYAPGALLNGVCHVVDFQSCGKGWKPWHSGNPPTRSEDICRFPASASYNAAVAVWRRVFDVVRGGNEGLG